MATPRSTGIRLLLAAGIAGVIALGPGSSEASGGNSSVKKAPGPSAWCAPDPGIEALPGDACYLNGESRLAPRRTLVIFLHGAIAKNTTWSWNHERMLLRLAKATNVEVLFPRSPETDVGFVWPGSASAQARVEEQLINGWMASKTALENRSGRAFDEVFVMGFSSGAYFASSLAMRGRADVDGYAVFAGGQPMSAPASPEVRRSPVFVGVCADDKATAPHSRAFAGSLSAAGIPRQVIERPVGHGLDHVHFTAALAYLRRMHAKRPAVG